MLPECRETTVNVNGTLHELNEGKCPYYKHILSSLDYQFTSGNCLFPKCKDAEKTGVIHTSACGTLYMCNRSSL